MHNGFCAQKNPLTIDICFIPRVKKNVLIHLKIFRSILATSCGFGNEERKKDKNTFLKTKG